VSSKWKPAPHPPFERRLLNRAHLKVDLHNTERVAFWNSSLRKMVDGVDLVIASSHVGHRKPEAPIFASAAKLIGESPEDIL